MTGERWQQIKVLFDEVVVVPENDRSSVLEQRCAGDEELLSEVQRLLTLHSKADGFLESIPSLAEALRREAIPAGNTFQTGDHVAGRFRIARLIGRGGMGEVYEAVDETMNGLPVALKTIRGGLEWDGQMKARFRREVELSRQVTHENVCRVNELYEHELHPGTRSGKSRSVVLLSMELLLGETLSERIRRSGPFSPSEAWPLIQQMGAALDAAHRVGVIHRDFKSSNVMLVRSRDAELRAVVTDFGLAQAAPGSETSDQAATESSLSGTPDYMAPEQLAMRPPTAASDVYSFGVVIYQMLTGRLPYPSVDTLRQAVAQRQTPPERPSDTAPGLTAAWEKTILRCLAPEPEQRFKKPSDVVAALDPQAKRDQLSRRVLFSTAIVATAASAGLLIRDRWFAKSGQPVRIAVLPFENESGDKQLDVLSEGLADDAINALSRIPGLHVIARNSSFRFQQTRAGLAAAGGELNTDSIITGKLRKANGGIQVAVQLSDSRNDRVLWGETISRPSSQLSEIPALIAKAVVANLGISLSPPQSTALATRQTQNGEAYNHFLLGRKLAQKRTAEDLLKSVESYDKALQVDPAYALAMSEKAASLTILANLPGYPPDQYLPQAEQIALNALGIAPDLAEAHLSLGAIQQRLYWNWDEAVRRYRLAKDAAPASATARHWLAGMLSNLGRHDEALQEIRTARDLDPMSAPIHSAFGTYLMRAGKYAEAAAELELTIKMEPSFSFAKYFLAQTYSFSGQGQQAVQVMRDLTSANPGSPTHEALLAYVLARHGSMAEAKALVARLEAAWNQQYFPPYALAQAQAGLGDASAVFRWLDIAWQRRDPSLVILKVDPVLAHLRDRPQFAELITRLHLQ